MIFVLSLQQIPALNPDAAGILAGQGFVHSAMHHHTMTSTPHPRGLAVALLE